VCACDIPLSFGRLEFLCKSLTSRLSLILLFSLLSLLLFCPRLQNAGSGFEELFEEEIRHESCALHVNVLAVLLDHCGTSFNGRSMWELTDGRIDRCLAVLSAFLKTFAHGQPRRLEAALRVLYELSVAENYLDCELAEVASLPELENLTKNLHKNSNMLTKAALDTPVIEAAVNALRPMVALLGPIREGDGEYDAGEDLAVFLSSIESLLSFVHNLLLFSTESTMQLRKHLTKTRLFEDVLMPYTTALIHSSLVSGARRRLKLKQLLRALTILTCKIAVFRQVFANPQGISMILLITAALDLKPAGPRGRICSPTILRWSCSQTQTSATPSSCTSWRASIAILRLSRVPNRASSSRRRVQPCRGFFFVVGRPRAQTRTR